MTEITPNDPSPSVSAEPTVVEHAPIESASSQSESERTAIPSLRKIPDYPVIAVLCTVALTVTALWWAKADISGLIDAAAIQQGQVWRLFTDIFPHTDFLHIAFNVYWTWVFGTAIEARLGHAKTFWLIVALAFGSSAVQFALDGGGVGLSGVIYGFFGLLWMLSKKDERFRGTMPSSTTNLFLGWFVLCVVFTLGKIWKIGNYAHGGGAVLGILIGLAMAEPTKRTMYSTFAVAFMAVGLWGATAGRGTVNFSSSYGYDQARAGYDALQVGNYTEAAHYFADASTRIPKEPAVWFDLGVAYERMGDAGRADAAYQTAASLKPGDVDFQAAAARHGKSAPKVEPTEKP